MFFEKFRDKVEERNGTVSRGGGGGGRRSSVDMPSVTFPIQLA